MWGWPGRGTRAAPCVLREPGPSGASSDQEAGSPHLIGVIRKVDLVENLGGFVLDGLHLHQVWGVLPGPISENQERGGGAVRSQQVHGAMGSREQRELWSQTPVLIPVHHFLPGDSHLTSQSLQFLNCRRTREEKPAPRPEAEEEVGFCRTGGRKACSCPPEKLCPEWALRAATWGWLAAALPQGHVPPHPQGTPTSPAWLGTPPRPCPELLALCLCSSGTAAPQGFLEALQAVEGERAVLARLHEALHVRQEDVAGREEARAQPEQLPAPLLAIPAGRGAGSSRGTQASRGPEDPKGPHVPRLLTTAARACRDPPPRQPDPGSATQSVAGQATLGHTVPSDMEVRCSCQNERQLCQPSTLGSAKILFLGKTFL